MNRRSFITALAGLPIVGWAAGMFGLPKPTAKSGITEEAKAYPHRVSVTLDGIKYTLPCWFQDGSVMITNTTGREIPSGTLLFVEEYNEPA